MISRLHDALSRWERAVARFAISPWSSGVLIVVGVLYVASEALRHKTIGWDGFLTVAAFEVGLATLRRVGR